MQSPSSKKSIFELPELVEQIASYLTCPDISKCLLTCRLLQHRFEPYLYRELTVQQDSNIHQDAWSLRYWTWPRDREYIPPNQTRRNASVQAAKPYTCGMEAPWVRNLSSVRSVVATCYSGILLDILTSGLEDESKPTREDDKDKEGKEGKEKEREEEAPDHTREALARKGLFRTRQSLSQLRQLKIDYGYIGEERRGFFPISGLITLLRHSCCRLFLTELWLPKVLFVLPDRSRHDSSRFLSWQDAGNNNGEEEDENTRNQRRRRQLELQHQEDIRLVQECVKIITSRLEQLKVVVIHQKPTAINGQHVESRLAMDLIHGLLKIKTLERLECQIEAAFFLEQLRVGFAAPQWPLQLKYLNLSHIAAPGQLFWRPLLQNYGAHLEGLGVSLEMLDLSTPTFESMIQQYCPKLCQLIVDTSSDNTSYSQIPRFRLSGFLEAAKSRTMTRRDTNHTIQFNDNRSSEGSVSPRIVSFRIGTHGGHYGSLRCLLEDYWDMLEEIVVDQLTAPSKSAELEQLLSLKCSSRLSTFSVSCGPWGHLWMEKLCPKSTPWPCAAGLRVLRLTVGRAPDELSASLVESFYNLVGQCSQLEELAIGYSIEKGSDRDDVECIDPLDPVNVYQFWDMTVRPSSWSTNTPIFTRARGCLQFLSGLSKLRTLSLTRGDLWSRMGQAEVEFVAKHWPVLQTIEIAVKHQEQLRRLRTLPHWQWLIQKRWDLNLKCWLKAKDGYLSPCLTG